VWQVLDLARYRQQSGLPVADFVVQQAGGTDDGLVRDWPRPDAGADRHRAYALQWYALAALAAGLTGWYVWNGLWRTKRDNRHPVRSDA
jgi:cytochrome oxidase assembly protein ShyY1